MPKTVTTLKPCPFCGNNEAMAMKANRDSELRLYPIVRCMKCYAEVSGHNDDYSENARSAIEAWNRRAS